MFRAAVELADDGGIDAVTMRRLAKGLGVEAMSLYNHVANKDDILSGMLDLTLREIEVPDDEKRWKAALRRHAVSAHETFRSHPWACQLALSPSPGRVLDVQIGHMEFKLRRLRDGLGSEDLTYHGLHALDSHILGFTLWELSHKITAENVGDLAASFLRQFPADEYPSVYEHVEQHLTGFGRGRDAFEFGLDLILDGLERIRRQERRALRARG